MTIWEKMKRALLPGRIGRRRQVQEKISLDMAEPLPEHPEIPMPESAADPEAAVLVQDREIDFSRVQDLEAYTENLNVPQESIERWISAGLLYPDEIRTAERMLKIIRKKVEHSRAA